jgi:nucleotide-binding universal stress UspA family protein
MTGQVLLCYDGSEESRRAIAAAGGLVSGRRAIVLNVGPPLTPAESVVLASPATIDFEHVNAQSAREVAEQGAALAREAGFEVEVRGGVGAPVLETIVVYAEEIDADVIVVGTRAMNGFGELVKGSTSHKVAEHAGRPVLVVPRSHDSKPGPAA